MNSLSFFPYFVPIKFEWNLKDTAVLSLAKKPNRFFQIDFIGWIDTSSIKDKTADEENQCNFIFLFSDKECWLAGGENVPACYQTLIVCGGFTSPWYSDPDSGLDIGRAPYLFPTANHNGIHIQILQNLLFGTWPFQE